MLGSGTNCNECSCYCQNMSKWSATNWIAILHSILSQHSTLPHVDCTPIEHSNLPQSFGVFHSRSGTPQCTGSTADVCTHLSVFSLCNGDNSSRLFQLFLRHSLNATYVRCCSSEFTISSYDDCVTSHQYQLGIRIVAFQLTGRLAMKEGGFSLSLQWQKHIDIVVYWYLSYRQLILNVMPVFRNLEHSNINAVIVRERAQRETADRRRRGREGDGPGGNGAKSALMHSPESGELRSEKPRPGSRNDEPPLPTKLKGHYDSWTV